MASAQTTANIAVTTGDIDGIGLEVTLKALLLLRSKSTSKYFIYRNKETPLSLRQLERKVLRNIHHKNLEFLYRDTPPPYWVQEAAHACINGEYHALATAPLSKEIIKSSGVEGIGHTDILKKCSNSTQVNMAFLGTKFNVLLATGHLPLKEVSSAISIKSLCSALIAANRLRSFLPTKISRKPIALLGLNPHAGEGGIIGLEEITIFKSVLKQMNNKKIPVVGPLVPDAAFLQNNWSQFSLFVCPYHDQGLIPFKMIHGRESGVHISVGLPFVRTSVDHGTAKDIFGKNCADPRSMLEALIWAERLFRKAKNGI